MSEAETPPQDPEPEVPGPDPRIAELTAALQRAQADFQNFRARTERQKGEWRDEILSETVTPFLGILDTLDRALAAAKAAKGEGGTLEGFVSGVSRVSAQAEKALTSLGVTRVEAEGRPFDPKSHEVVCEVPAPEGVEAGRVVAVVEAGYRAGGRLLRPAKVTVAAGSGEKG